MCKDELHMATSRSSLDTSGWMSYLHAAHRFLDRYPYPLGSVASRVMLAPSVDALGSARQDPPG